MGHSVAAMNTYCLHHNDGSASRFGISYRGALAQLREKYGEQIVLRDAEQEGRIFVWQNDADAESDDGENAVAELIAEDAR